MMNSPQKLQKLSEIVNKYIEPFTEQKTCKCDFSESSYVFRPYNDVIYIFLDIFSKNALVQKDTSKSFFHYKKFEYACEFIEKEIVLLSALSNYQKINTGDDIKEYQHFFDVINVGTEQKFIDEQKDNYFVFCLTEDNCTEKFWNEYADDGKGLCLEMEIKYKPSCMCDKWYNLNKICYDDGSKFEFFANMQKEIHLICGKYLVIDGLAKFAALYKRNKFEWERETRLLINKNIKNKFTITKKDNKTFMTVPFENDLFSIILKSVTIGKNLNYCQKEKIVKLLKKKNIKQIDG